MVPHSKDVRSPALSTLRDLSFAAAAWAGLSAPAFTESASRAEEPKPGAITKTLEVDPAENTPAQLPTLEDRITRLLPELTELRHEIHANPELGFEERETARRILAKIQNLPGMTVKSEVAGTGIVATLDAGKTGPCIALRADMDALALQEGTRKPYASKVPGKMHACGHDGHVTCLVGAAIVLSQLRDELNGPVKFIFQPAEEGGAGGEQMCNAGALVDPRVDAIFGLHTHPYLDVGKVASRNGAILGTSSDIEITIKGVGTHAAAPHLGIDPVVVAAQIVLGAQTIVSRFTDPLESGVVVSIPMIKASDRPNVIPETVTLKGTIRALSDRQLKLAGERLTLIAQNTAAASGATAQVKIEAGYPALINEPRCTALLYKAAETALGQDKVVKEIAPFLGTEDFSYYLRALPVNLGNFWFLGIRSPEQTAIPMLHSPTLDFNDQAIPIGVRVHCEVVRQFQHDAQNILANAR